MTRQSTVLVITGPRESPDRLDLPALGAPLVYATADTVSAQEWYDALMVLVDDRHIASLLDKHLPPRGRGHVVAVYTDRDDPCVFRRAAAIGATEAAHAGDDLLKLHALTLVWTQQMQWEHVFGADA
ncbi:hypothetical protein G3I40_12310 [Streptomyces sp. SID14478]|uniref:hypothetical protein n=1 Tax=Streptomyces sp. SID14478 TaxID=2706073 RepID=UPI0013D962E4|nr:hypothetical protein [Streptomyces sp. SID14478]NEB75998.1 hypothetical protein [Streptomyces sp. SID14478]